MNEDHVQLVFSAFKKLLPNLRELLILMDENDGAFCLEDTLLTAIPDNKIFHWAHLYEKPSLMAGVPALDILSEDSVKKFSEQLAVATPETMDSLKTSINQEILDNSIDEDIWERSELNDLEKLELLTIYLPTLFNFQAVMTHGCSMIKLVQKAKSDHKDADKAFCQAVQIDRTVLYSIPYFCNRLLKLQLSDDHQFKTKLANAIKGKIHGKKFGHPLVWYLLAALNDVGVLDLPIARLMAFCEEQGIYGFDDDHSNESLRKLRDEYIEKAGDQT